MTPQDWVFGGLLIGFGLVCWLGGLCAGYKLGGAVERKKHVSAHGPHPALETKPKNRPGREGCP